MIKIKLLIAFLFFLSSCSSFEFVYDNKYENFLYFKTNVVSSGDDYILVKNQIENIIKKTEGPNRYVLTVVSKKNLTNLIIKDNQAATQIENTFKIRYTLTDQEGLCLFDQQEIITSLDYGVKSSGYNFGSDLAEKDINKKNINKNIISYLGYLLKRTDGIKCINDSKS